MFNSFNNALQAKNWWDIQTKPNRCSLLEYGPGCRPSYAWSSIYKVGVALKGGCVWRISNRDRVNLWLDRWLPEAVNSLLV